MKIIVTLLILLSSSVHASTYKLATITSDIDRDVTEYFVETDDQNKIESMRYMTTMPNGAILKDYTIPVETILTDGIVIVERDGQEAVKIELEDFNVNSGGIVKLKYLYNGITGSKQSKKLFLGQPVEKFELVDLEGHRVNRMFFKANRSIIGVIGVKYISTSYQEKKPE